MCRYIAAWTEFSATEIRRPETCLDIGAPLNVKNVRQSRRQRKLNRADFAHRIGHDLDGLRCFHGDEVGLRK